MIERKRSTKEQAYQKIKHFASYQQRCHQEVKEKLYSFGLYSKEVDELISQLIEENFLNEEKFAELFAGGKFRMKHWGRVKIRYELKQKRISEYCIRKAINTIDEDAYQRTIQKLAMQKWESLSGEKNQFTKKGKAMDYLLAKGYEMDIIKKALEQISLQ